MKSPQLKVLLKSLVSYTGHVCFIDEDEFHQSIEAERITDDYTKPVGMAWNTDEDSVFYVYRR